MKEHVQFSYLKSSLEAENFALREKNELLTRDIDEMLNLIKNKKNNFFIGQEQEIIIKTYWISQGMSF